MGAELLVEVGATVERMGKMAEASKMKVHLDADRLKSAAESGDKEAGVPPITIRESSGLYGAYEHIYAPFGGDARRISLFGGQVKFKTSAPDDDSLFNPFSQLDQIKLQKFILQAPRPIIESASNSAIRGCGYDIASINKHGLLSQGRK